MELKLTHSCASSW